jgi:benzodiazapine receptor
MKPAIVATGAVAGAAVTGAVASAPGSDWYRRLRKPAWQPPPAAFPLVWTPLYATIAVAGTRALAHAGDRGRPRPGTVLRTLLVDLTLNAAWTALFFRARRPVAALAEIACLDAANLALVRRAWQADRAAGALLVPYAVWCAFATVLNAEIVRLNRGR